MGDAVLAGDGPGKLGTAKGVDCGEGLVCAGGVDTIVGDPDGLLSPGRDAVGV